MWTQLRIEVHEQFAAVEAFFKATRGIDKSIEQTAKGLAFVHMYAAYESTVRAIVRTAIAQIEAHGHKLEDLTPSLMALFLDQHLTRLQDSGKKDIWDARIQIFEQLFSGYPAKVSNTVFPNDGNHFRQNQLKTIFRILGLKRMPARRRRHLQKVDEVVHRRNAVAHGEETAGAVGRCYSRTDVLHTIQQIRSVCLLLVSEAEKQCLDKPRHCRRR